MHPPTKREAKGYDVVIYVDNEGDVVCKSYTRSGDQALSQLANDYQHGDIVEIYCTPPEFLQELPDHLSVGILNSHTKQIKVLAETHLH